MTTSRYAMAMKHGTPEPSPDWHERLLGIEGVEVEGRSTRSAQFVATPEALARVRLEFGSQFHIEEVRERGPM